MRFRVLVFEFLSTLFFLGLWSFEMEPGWFMKLDISGICEFLQWNSSCWRLLDSIIYSIFMVAARGGRTEHEVGWLMVK